MLSKSEMGNFRRQQEENAETNRMHDTFFKKFKAGTLEPPNIQWHQDDGINLDLQADKFIKKLLVHGFTVIPNVNLENLLNKMTKADANFFRKKMLYEDPFDRKISRVLSHWYNSEKLIPPTIIVFNKEYINLACPNGKFSRQLRPVDGKHRLVISCYFEIESLPILVWNKQIDLIKRILKK